MAKGIKKVKQNSKTENVKNNNTTKKFKITKNGLVEVDQPKVEEEKRSKNKEKCLKVLITEPRSRFVEIGERVQRKELKWLRFCTENNIGVHYYLILI
jgi:hypothetical protein